ncbi:ABC transporter ATP-binding protein [Salinisphaera sp. LB1]|uniref:ABC transporter ATP-binding protein n=1 Tax=Salinisphaera sp. LB1 TaxID=2183911 RepID=UPI000FEF568C|nr:ABC transporter ATP-binding protein [Salinisphaera sp. LB1]
MSEALLQLEDVESGYGELQVLWGVSLQVQPHGMTTLVGANGAGKTTLLRAATGSISAWRGRVRFDGEDVTRLSAHDKASRGLILVPEGRQLFNDMTVEENLELGAYAKRARQKFSASLERVYNYFPRLKERRDQKAGTFSGGEQQMLAVARGLMADPKVLIIDELSLGLSPLLTQQLFGTLRELKSEGLTILLVEQNLHLALALSDYAYVLAEGRLHSQGPSREVARDPEVRKAYMGV